jgi:hypothetical protein
MAMELVLQRKTKPLSLKPYETKSQKFFFWSSLICLIIGFVLGLAMQFWRSMPAGYVALGSLFLSMLLGLGYQLALTWPLVSKLRHSEKSLSHPIISEFNDDLDLIAELSRDFQPHHLEYAKDSFALMAEQLRLRIGLLVGAIDKVGVIPLAVTAYISGLKAVKDGVIVFSAVEWVWAAFILLYLLAVHMVSVAQQIDRIVLVYKQAMATQKAGRSYEFGDRAKPNKASKRPLT